MAAKKTGSKGKKKGHGIRVVDGDEEVTSIVDTRIAKKAKSLESAVAVLSESKPARVKKTAVVEVEGVDWGVRTREGSRIASDGRGDRVAQELANCKDVDSLVAFASEFIPEGDVREYLGKAPNFGQFRMVIGNRIRGAINRAERERLKKEKK